MSMTSPELAEKAGISTGYASMLLSGKRKSLSLAKAFQIYDATGLKFGILDGASDETIEDLRRKVAA
jgi:transcriptional regulator with XRE-family HTH domain